ncbi:ATP-binding protein [Mycobacteroides chelonae]|uniref:ATP-binding protein n=2 Tax=Bacteria TaxID=2 RepID=UPI000994709E|nr:ATP-binding protein [Mycobacteroides chelonae]
MGGVQRDVARVFSDVRDFPIFVSHIDDQTRIPFAPWRAWDGAAAVLFGGVTVWRVYANVENETGLAFPVALFGAVLTITAVVLARQIPISRPSPIHRVVWWLQCVFGTQSDGGPYLSAPEGIDDNIVFTKRGVYAVYVIGGAASSALAPYQLRQRIAKWHRRLAQNMPTPMVFTGLVAPVHPMVTMQRMLAGYENCPEWESEVRDWEPYLRIEPMFETVFMLRVPIDGGLQGRTATGRLQRMWRSLLGVDDGDEETLDGYRRISEQILAKIPAKLRARAATPSQIQWWRYREMTAGVADIPFPPNAFGPRQLSKEDLLPEVHYDLGDQQGARARRPRWLRWIPSFAPVLRVQAKGFPSSYQALLPVAEIPRDGMAFPGADFLNAVEDIETDATIDWIQHVRTRPVERALLTVDSAERNLRDQYVQRAGHKSGDDDLIERMASARDYNRLLRNNKLDRECESTSIITVGTRSTKALKEVVQQIHDEFAEMEIALALPKGAQRDLRRTGNPGGESGAPTSQFAHPTNTKHWGMFGSLTSTTLGNDTGMLLGMNLSSRRPAPVFLDLEGAPGRRHPMGMIVYGPPGGGKSMLVKRVVKAGLQKKTRFTIDDPGAKKEWKRAFGEEDGAVVLDLAHAEVSLCPLRNFARTAATEHFLDHLVPMVGFDPQGTEVRQLRQLLRPDERVAESTGELLRYLKDLRGEKAREYESLTNALDAASTVDYLQAIFNDALPVRDLSTAPVVIWLTSSLELPDEANTNETHLYMRQSPRARAGMALYGLMTVLTRVNYANSPGATMSVREESRVYHRSPAGRKESTREITQGRKEEHGLLAIDQDFRTFEHIKEEYLPTRIITPYDAGGDTTGEAAEMLRHNGIDPAEYPELLEMEVVEGHGYALFIDEFRRAGMVDLFPPAQQELVELWDTNTRRQRLQAVS